MTARIPREELPRLLARRENWGCHPQLGTVGTLTRFGKARVEGHTYFKCGLQTPDGETHHVLLNQRDFLRRRIDKVAEAFVQGAPGFLLNPDGRNARYGVIFLSVPEEVLLLLRLNLELLRQRDDLKSKQLLREFTGLAKADLPPADDLCLALIDMRDHSAERFLDLINQMEDRKSILSAADRGEMLSFTERCGEVGGELADTDVKYLRNVVRAHYMTKVDDMLKKGLQLSPLGQKVFSRLPIEDFSAGERQAILTMATSVASGSQKDHQHREGERYFMQ